MAKPLSRALLALSLVVGASVATSPAAAQTAQVETTQTGRDRLNAYLTGLANAHLDTRAALIAGLATAEDARLRQQHVRAALGALIELESVSGPVVSHSTGVSQEDGYRIERIYYESLPGFRVTANVYVPVGGGRHPAIIIQPGHGITGKISNFTFARHFVRAGFVVLSIDIVSEGERLQHYNADLGDSIVGRPTGEHSMAFGQALPTGGHVSRYFIQDAIRGVDYLAARPDVDAARIGAFGCSGGGTITTYLAALDPRIAATATACYTNTFRHVLAPNGPGPQDAEQSIPFFIERGLDLPDWVEAVAPRPYAVVATTEDFFPIDGARAAYAEARRFYALMGAEDRITMIEGPGGHGNLGPVAAQIVTFFTRWLKDDATPPQLDTGPAGDPGRLLVTETGQISTSFPGETIQTLSRARADATRPAQVANETNAARATRLRAAIADVARISVQAGDTAPAATLGDAGTQNGYVATPVRFTMAEAMDVPAVFATPARASRRPTLLVLTEQPASALNAVFERWTGAGWNVLALEPRGAGGTEEAKSPLTGDWTLLSLRALLVGKTPIGMRTDDAIAAINWLATRRESSGQIALYGHGALGPVALHAAVLDPRISAVTLDNSIITYRDFVERAISRDMAEVNLPGVLRRYDLPDLAAALGPRVTLINPVNSVSERLREAQARQITPSVSTIILRNTNEPFLPPNSRR